MQDYHDLCKYKNDEFAKKPNPSWVWCFVFGTMYLLLF
jgi:hypothetical protein